MELTVNPEYERQVPKLTEQEYNELMQSMKDYGQLSPILVNQDGVVLDGHHRFRICHELGLEPQYKVMIFKDEVDERVFVTKSNLSGKGRHLNKFRRTELALRLKPDLKEIAKKRQEELGRTHGKGKGKDPLVRNQTKGRVDEEIAKMANVSRDTVKKVEKILEYLMEEGETQEATDDLEKLRSEDISINQAYNRILDKERLDEIYDAIEPHRPQIESIIKEWGKLGEDSLGQFTQLFETGPYTQEQQKEDTRKKFEEFGILQYFVEILSGVFGKLIANRQLDPKEELSKALESIQRIKRVTMEKDSKKEKEK
jgi:ParB-like chromosome segregation protein Spo0J